MQENASWLAVPLASTKAGWRNEPLLREMLGLAIKAHEAKDFGAVEAGAPAVGFCSTRFLTALPLIPGRTCRAVFANRMIRIFGKGREAMAGASAADLHPKNTSGSLTSRREMQ